MAKFQQIWPHYPENAPFMMCKNVGGLVAGLRRSLAAAERPVRKIFDFFPALLFVNNYWVNILTQLAKEGVNIFHRG
jgi:hypothetical protein